MNQQPNNTLTRLNTAKKYSRKGGIMKETSTTKKDPTKTSFDTVNSSQNDNFIELKGKQFRKTQSCDRCRLKKIKCDGRKPACGNCMKAKFHCVTFDKLSRRGFPKGYTEALEQELIKLKKILKDNNIEVTKETNSNDKIIGEFKPNGKNGTVIENARTFPSSVLEKSPEFLPTSIFTSIQTSITKSPVINHSQFQQHSSIPPEISILVNDTFHKQKNIIYSNQNHVFLGHNFWNKLMSSSKNKNNKTPENNFDYTLEKEEKIIQEQHISLMVNVLNLNSKYYYLPQFLVQKYKYDENLLKKLLLDSIKQFFNIQNSLIPLLYPTSVWENSLMNLIAKFESGFMSQGVKPDIKPHILLCLLIIIQISWSCLDNLRLLQVIRSICINSFLKDIERIQILNLSAFLFMGHGQKSANENIWTSSVVIEILNLNLSLIKTVGLYINSKNLKPLLSNESSEIESFQKIESNGNSIPIVTHWCFEFLNTWWSLIQGLPRTNFITSEFQPKMLPTSKKSELVPFSILLKYVTEKLNGYNLLYCLKNGLNYKVVVENELYRDTLKSKNLYFYSIEKNISFEKISNSVSNQEVASTLETNTPNNNTGFAVLERTEVIEIQLTLYYLLITLIIYQKYKFPRGNLERIAQNNNSDSVAYEILCLYFLLMKSASKSEETVNQEQQLRPLQFTVSHILPCSNEDIIKLSLDIIIEWGSNQKMKLKSKNSLKQIKNEELWRFKKYKNFLNEWCQIWFESSDVDDPQFLKIQTTFDINFKSTNIKMIKHEYSRSLDEFNNLGYSNNILLKTDSKAIMDQFNIFESSINNISSLLPQPVNMMGMEASGNVSNILSQNVDVKIDNYRYRCLREDKTKEFQNNIFSFSTTSAPLASSFLEKQEETDDGYAEDDDEDEDDNKPLEIPFIHKRRSSLFHQKPIQLPQKYTIISSEDINQTEGSQNSFKRSFKEMIFSRGSTIFAKIPGKRSKIPTNSLREKQNSNVMLPGQQLLIPYIPIEEDILSKTLIKSPFVSTLFFQGDESTTMLGNFKSNNLLLKQFQQQQRLKTQLNLFQKEVTPRSFVDIMMTGVNKWNNGEINKTTTTSTDDKNVDSEENRDSEPTTATC